MSDKLDVEKLQNVLTVTKKKQYNSEKNSKNDSPCSSEKTVEQLIGESDSDDDSVELNNLRDSLAHNVECIEILSSLEIYLLKVLDECIKERMAVSQTITHLQTPGSKERREISFLFKVQVMSLHKYCCAPYFKDSDGYASPHNVDISERRKSQYINCFDVIKKKPWNNNQKRDLEKGILSIELESIDLEKRSATSTNDSSSCTKTYNVASLKEKIKSKQGVKECLAVVIGDREREYDWLKLSASFLDGVRSPHECRAVWFNYLHPKIKKTAWSVEEEHKLKKAAEDNKLQNWGKVALDMGTGRSPYQCIGYYKIAICDMSDFSWTDQEIVTVNQYVNDFKYGFHIPWSKVAYLIDGRTGGEVIRKWQNKYADVKRGSFSKAEDILLVAGLRHFGTKWCEIAEYFPNRSSMQVRGRIQVLKGRELEGTPWTEEDDNLIEKLVGKYGVGNWSKISGHFLNRTASQIRSRYKSISIRKEKLIAGIPAKPLIPFIKNKDDSRIGELWQTAVNIIERRKLDKSEGSQTIVMNELSKLLTPHKKRGRKVGQVNRISVLNQYYNKYFFVTYEQRGGRGKTKCLEHMVPIMAYRVILALQLLRARIYLPPKEAVMSDSILYEMDKDIVSYFVHRKSLIQGKSKVINFLESSENSLKECSEHCPQSISSADDLATEQEWRNSISSWKLCSPNNFNLIGLRSMLLNLENIKAQRNGTYHFTELPIPDTSEEYRTTELQQSSSGVSTPSVTTTLFDNSTSSISSSVTSGIKAKSIIASTSSVSSFPKSTCKKHSSANTLSHNEALLLFQNRIKTLFSWAGIMSVTHPRNKTITVCTVQEQSTKKEPKKRGKKRKRSGTQRKAGVDKETESSNEKKPKRQYVKSGKYAAKNLVSGATEGASRRSARISKSGSSTM